MSSAAPNNLKVAYGGLLEYVHNWTSDGSNRFFAVSSPFLLLLHGPTYVLHLGPLLSLPPTA